MGKWLTASLAIVLLAIGILWWNAKKTLPAGADMVQVELEVVPLPGGWAYDILVDNKVYIHQACIPAVAVLQPFSTEADAKKAGGLALQKLVHRRIPSLSVQELDSLGIRYR